ncbi:MAG TPA: cupin domain-containing protein [Vicinamibacterales bacterium]|nr:cupin domain-containing protein [Vicinamibacterales bacterium]
MDDRRTFLKLAAALVPASLAAQSPAPAVAPRELARHTLTGPLADFDVVLIELNPGPGTGRDHRHTGPVLGYVLDGQVRFGVDHGPEQIVAAGSTFFEQTGALHSTFGSANANARARVLAFMVVPKGNSGTVPA